MECIISTKSFDAPLFQNWHIYLSMCSLSFVFVMKLFVKSFNLVLHLLWLGLLFLDYFVKWFVLLDFIFVFPIDYLCMFHQPAKICCKSYKWIIFKLIFIYFTDFGEDFYWLIPRHTREYSVWWLIIFCLIVFYLTGKKEAWKNIQSASF